MQHAVAMDVIDETAFAAQQPQVVQPLDRLAD
jgi:hypothetical protein